MFEKVCVVHVLIGFMWDIMQSDIFINVIKTRSFQVTKDVGILVRCIPMLYFSLQSSRAFTSVQVSVLCIRTGVLSLMTFLHPCPK